MKTEEIKDCFDKIAVREKTSLSGEAIPLEKAIEVFDRLADMEDIAFGYTSDGCYARAHIMCRRMMDSGLSPGKAWAFEGGGEMLKVDIAGNKTYWGWHVAPALPVRMTSGEVQDMVIDPSLFDGPVSLKEWGASMGAKTENLQIAEFGVAPKGHTGDYNTCQKTSGETDKDAKRTMKSYCGFQEKKIRTVLPSQSRQQVLKNQHVNLQGNTWVSMNAVNVMVKELNVHP